MPTGSRTRATGEFLGLLVVEAEQGNTAATRMVHAYIKALDRDTRARRKQKDDIIARDKKARLYRARGLAYNEADIINAKT